MRKTGVIILLMCAGILMAADMELPIRVGLLLPLQTEQKQRDKNMDRFVDFYTGALMAVYAKQEMGQKVEVYTWDVGKSVNQLEQVLASDTLERMDMIIGPVYPAQVRRMAAWSGVHHVRTLLPFVYEVPELETNPYLLQFNPSEETEAEAVVNYLDSMDHSVRVVFVQAEKATVPTSVRALYQCVQHGGIEYVFTSIQQIMADSLTEVLSDTMENIVVMNTERYANLRQVMPYLVRAAQGHSLTLMSRYSWQGEPIILQQIYTTMFKQVTETEREDYEALYSRFVTTERTQSHPSYDLLGRDIMDYVLESVAELRDVEQAEADGVLSRVYEGLQSDMRFVRVSDEGGYQNTNIQIIRVE